MNEEESADVLVKVLAINTIIETPLSWEGPNYCKILDLKECHYEEVIRLLKHHYIKEEPILRASCLVEDRESREQYFELIRTWINDSTSLVAISEASGRIIGALIIRINSLLDRTNTYSRVQLYPGKALSSMMNLKSALILNADAYNKFKIDAYLRIYILCVHPSYEKYNLSAELLYTSYQVAKSLGLEAVGGIFSSIKSQSIASEVGFENLSEIKYSDWRIDNEIVFDDPGMGNYTIAFMGKLISDDEELETIMENRRVTRDEEANRRAKNKCQLY